MFFKSLLAAAIETAIKEHFGDASLQFVLERLSPCANHGFLSPEPSTWGRSLQRAFSGPSHGKVDPPPQNSRPIRQPPCPRQAHARQREKAAARELANNA